MGRCNKWNTSGYYFRPILFIIFINDLPDLCKQFVNVYLFADDAKLYPANIATWDPAGTRMVHRMVPAWFLSQVPRGAARLVYAWPQNCQNPLPVKSKGRITVLRLDISITVAPPRIDFDKIWYRV